MFSVLGSGPFWVVAKDAGNSSNMVLGGDDRLDPDNIRSQRELSMASDWAQGAMANSHQYKTIVAVDSW